MEAQFHLQCITTEVTKFYHILSAFTPRVVGQLSVGTLNSRSFRDVKPEVIQMFEQTKLELFEQLISTATMTGWLSAYMNELLIFSNKMSTT
ncbi:uncharacterized protein LOC135102784 isoform X2 [Scylla paramamosain]|uniref:uncharacterized protein LOC135102784 isoform X2 n=1 Tax=Scylla paramamosain TaxID=85552 RepID=UPI003082B719